MSDTATTTATTDTGVLTKAEQTYNDLMGWKGITYVIVFMYVFMAGYNIYKHLKR
jgi:hypothetical protein